MFKRFKYKKVLIFWFSLCILFSNSISVYSEGTETESDIEQINEVAEPAEENENGTQGEETEEHLEENNIDLNITDVQVEEEEPTETFTAENVEETEIQSNENSEEPTEYIEEAETVYLEKYITCADKQIYKISMMYDSNSGLPMNDVTLNAVEVETDLKYLNESSDVLNVDKAAITFMRLFDIYLTDSNGTVFQPTDKVIVKIENVELINQTTEDLTDSRVVHFKDEETVEELVTTETESNTVTFETSSFSVFAITSTKTEENEITADIVGEKLYEDDNVIISGKIPAGSIVEAVPVEYSVETEETPFITVLAYDVNIYANADMKKLGVKWQPENDTISVTYKSEAFNDFHNLKVFHAEDINSEPEYISDVEIIDNSAVFGASSFSIYAVVDEYRAPEDPEITVQTVDELQENSPYLLSVTKTAGKKWYFGNSINNNLITKILNTVNVAGRWYLEHVSDNVYNFYTYVSEIKVYLNMDDSGNVYFSETEKTGLNVELYNSRNPGQFYIYKTVGNKKYGLNMRGGDSGKGFNGWNGKDTGSIIEISYPSAEYDPVFDGKTYGLIIAKSPSQSALLTNEAMNNETRLKAATVLEIQNPFNASDRLYKSQNREDKLQTWTFNYIGNGKYHITSVKDGKTVYLSVTNGAVKTMEEPDETCELFVTVGTGKYEGKIRISNANNYSPNLYNGQIGQGFGYKNDLGDNEWFDLVTPSNLTEDDFSTYSASLRSISDKTITTGEKVVLYTRIWNSQTLTYDYYIVNHDGTLLRAYESGGNLCWNGTRINTAEFEFTEYFYEDGVTPNHYYDFQNTYSKKYLAPQLTTEEIFFDKPIGVNLNGRRYGDSYSTIVAWDDEYYAYSGLTIKDGKVISTDSTKAMDFYIAVINDSDDESHLDEITPTINNEDYGITIKMQDYGLNPKDIITIGSTQTAKEQHEVIGVTKYTNGNEQPGLVSTNLENGYPVSTATGISLQELFNNTTDANHLFPETNYLNTGYFEFDSAESFAKYNEDTGNFNLYHDLGTADTKSSNSMKHGQFFPYNEIQPGVFSTKNPQNIYAATGTELSHDNPRKGESLHLVENPNYYYGMEINVNFFQPTNGQDGWGNDIIFQFTGDDDFWLYINNELIIDLGGIHSALPGSINFRTGDVEINGKKTTLREVVKNNYKTRNPEASDEEVNEYLDDIFQLQPNGKYVYKDNSALNMKMFYMERGGGAANLKLKFNINSVKENQILLNKTVSGTSDKDYAFAEFPYQIYYSNDNMIWNQLVQETVDETCNSVYKNTSVPVDFRASYTPPGSSTAYSNVFFLKSGETAAVTFPIGAKYYYVKECGLNNNIYDEVKINGNPITAVNSLGDSSRSDYTSEIYTIDDNRFIGYDNHVNKNALRTLTIEKTLLDERGNVIPDDGSVFNFRLYFMNEDASAYSLAYLQDYHVINPQGEICYWEPSTQKFTSTGEEDFSQLDEDMKIKATFHTSSNGAISKIPAGYKVVMYEIPVGERFKIEERSNEIPDGYRFVRYERIDGSYISEDEPNEGTIRENSDPAVRIINKRTNTIIVRKYWSDSDFIPWHDDAFVALYENGELIENSVRRLTDEKPVVKYIFDELPCETIDSCIVKEVLLTGDITEDEDGVISNYDSIDVVESTDVITINAGTEEEYESYEYSPIYDISEVSGKHNNVQTTDVTNTRQGVLFVKTDLEGNPIEHAFFKFTDFKGDVSNFETKEDGKITNAYLEDDELYTIEETEVPLGYKALEDTIVLKSDAENNITLVSPETSPLIEVNNTEHLVKIKNKPMTFKAIKKNDDDELLQGVEFSLFRDINGKIDYAPIPGYETLTTDENGVIPLITESLPYGSYFLKETKTLERYDLLETPIHFTKNKTGTITLTEHPNGELLTTETDDLVETVLVITNTMKRFNTIKVVKNVTGNMGNRYSNFNFSLNNENFSLKHGQEKEYEVLTGETFTIKEKLSDASYSVSVKVELPTGEDVTSAYTYNPQTYTLSGNLDRNIIVTYTNNRDVAVPTNVPEVLVSGYMIAGLIVIAILWILKKTKLLTRRSN